MKIVLLQPGAAAPRSWLVTSVTSHARVKTETDNQTETDEAPRRANRRPPGGLRPEEATLAKAGAPWTLAADGPYDACPTRRGWRGPDA